MVLRDQLTRTTKEKLVLMCRNNGWKRYSSLTKPELVRFVFAHLNRYHMAARTIQRYYTSNKLNFRRYSIVNDNDFLTLELLDCKHLFFIRNHDQHQVFQFNPRSLLEFFLTTGNFINPFTRENITDNDLIRLHRWYISLHEAPALTYRVGSSVYTMTQQTNILSVKRSVSINRREETQRGQTIMRLNSQCDEIINSIVELALFTTTDGDVAAQIVVTIFSFWLPNYFENCFNWRLLHNDAARNNLRQLINHMGDIARNTIYGPVNRNIAESVLTICRANYFEMFGPFVA